MRDTMLSSCQTARKWRTIVMLTSSNHSVTLHFAELCPKIRPFFAFSPVFLRFSYALVPVFSPERQSIHRKETAKMRKFRKSGFFFANIIFLKVKMDMLSMSFFKKKDRMFTTFFPASFHLAGLGLKRLLRKYGFHKKSRKSEFVRSADMFLFRALSPRPLFLGTRVG